MEEEEDEEDDDDVDEEEEDDDEADDVALGCKPSSLALVKASTSSLFSRNFLVLMPYDSSSFLISPARMPLMSGKVEAHNRNDVPRVKDGTTKDRTIRRLELRNACIIIAKQSLDLLVLLIVDTIFVDGGGGGSSSLCCLLFCFYASRSSRRSHSQSNL